jgi:phage major head subunit gpT-like protein
VIINRGNLTALFTGFKTVFNGAFEGAASDWDKVGMLVPSTTSQETYAWLGMSTRFREWLGDRVIQNLKSHDFTIKNREFENTIGVRRSDIEDDQVGVYKPLFQQLGYDAKVHPDELIFALLAAGFASKCYDGQNFFDTDHPVEDEDGNEVSVSNMAAGAATPWFLLDASKPLRPFIFQRRRDYSFVRMDSDTDEGVFNRGEYRYGVDARANAGYGLWQLAFGSQLDLTAANYGAARTALLSMKGDRGKRLGVRPSLLVVPPSLEGAGLEVLQAEKNANGATNIYRNTAQLLVTPWLA